jgi:fructan beta-fructosidase
MDFEKGFTGRHSAPRLSKNKTLKMRIYVDVSSIELIADDGETVITDIFFPTEDFDKMALFGDNGVANLTSGQLWRLR